MSECRNCLKRDGRSSKLKRISKEFREPSLRSCCEYRPLGVDHDPFRSFRQTKPEIAFRIANGDAAEIHVIGINRHLHYETFVNAGMFNYAIDNETNNKRFDFV